MQRIEDTIRGGVDEKYLKVVKELKNYYYVEDVAAAALQMCAERGVEPEEVRRRTLIHTHFIPLKTKESVARVKGKPKPPSPPAETARPPAHGTHRKPQHHPPRKPASAAGPAREPAQQAQKKPSPPARGNQPGRSPGGHTQKKPAVQGSQPGRAPDSRPRKHQGAPRRPDDRRRGQ